MFPAARFGFENYVQAPIAYAFTLAAIGEETEAKKWLEEYLKFTTNPETRTKLYALLDKELKKYYKT